MLLKWSIFTVLVGLVDSEITAERTHWIVWVKWMLFGHGILWFYISAISVMLSVPCRTKQTSKCVYC